MNQNYWSSRLRGIEPYVPGEQPQDKTYVKLNTNENPYPPSPMVLAALREADPAALRRYPAPECEPLRDTLGAYYGLRREEIFVGNGSDEVLAFCNLAFMDEASPAVFPDITYSFYPVYAALFGAHCRVFPVREDFSIPLDELCRNDGTVLLTNPNAPTGIALPLCDLETVLKSNPDHAVIVDEAYVDFGAQSAVELIHGYDNLLVVQTFSKSRSLAGLRVGYAMGQAGLIAALSSAKNSFNSYTVDYLAQRAAQAAVEDRTYFDSTRSAIEKTRETTTRHLKNLNFFVLPSAANFLFASHRQTPAGELFRKLRDRGVLVRHFDKPRIDNFLRITIGTDQEMDTLFAALEEILEVGT